MTFITIPILLLLQLKLFQFAKGLCLFSHTIYIKVARMNNLAQFFYIYSIISISMCTLMFT